MPPSVASASGQKQTFNGLVSMSAIGGKADIVGGPPMSAYSHKQTLERALKSEVFQDRTTSPRSDGLAGRPYRSRTYDKGFAKVFNGRSAQLNGITMEPRAP